MENIWKKLLAHVTCLLNTENDLKCQVDLWDMDLLHMEGGVLIIKLRCGFDGHRI